MTSEEERRRRKLHLLQAVLRASVSELENAISLAKELGDLGELENLGRAYAELAVAQASLKSREVKNPA